MICRVYWLAYKLQLGEIKMYRPNSTKTLHGIPKGRIGIEFSNGLHTKTREYESTGAGTTRTEVPILRAQ